MNIPKEKNMNQGGPSTPQRMFPAPQMGATPNPPPNLAQNQAIRPSMPTQNPALFNNVISHQEPKSKSLTPSFLILK